MAADPPTGPTAWIAVSPDTTYWAGGRSVPVPAATRPSRPCRNAELLVSSREPPGRLTLTVEVDDLEARVRWLRDLGARLLQETPGAALVEDPEGNRALLVQRRPDEPGGPVRRSSARRRRS
jgi:catechol 2,3-dioxygenase-like lactoylglutathione lyase family enzyme